MKESERSSREDDEDNMSTLNPTSQYEDAAEEEEEESSHDRSATATTMNEVWPPTTTVVVIPGEETRFFYEEDDSEMTIQEQQQQQQEKNHITAAWTQLCHRLQHNLCTRLDLSNIELPQSMPELREQLGQAIRHNTSLRSIVIPIAVAYENDDNDNDSSTLLRSSLAYFLEHNHGLESITFLDSAIPCETRTFSSSTQQQQQCADDKINGSVHAETITYLLFALSRNTNNNNNNSSNNNNSNGGVDIVDDDQVKKETAPSSSSSFHHNRRELMFSNLRESSEYDWYHNTNAHVPHNFVYALQDGNFTSVSCHGCSEFFTELTVAGLATNTSLRKLSLAPHHREPLRNPSIIGNILATFFKSSRIELFSFYHVWKTNLDKAAPFMARNPHLRKVHLHGYDQADPWIVAANICTLLRESTILEKLSLDYFSFDRDNLKNICRAVHKNRSVKHLSLDRCGNGNLTARSASGNHVTTTSRSSDSSAFVAGVSICRPDMQSLSLQNMTIGPVLLQNISHTMQQRKCCIKKLCLGNMEEDQVKDLLTSLAKNLSCESLEISPALLSPDAVQLLGHLLGSETPCRLRELTLRCHADSPDTVVALSNVLAKESGEEGACHLEFLSLNYFAMNRDSLQILLTAVKESRTITRLHLQYSRLTGEAYDELFLQLPDLHNLKDLRFDWPPTLYNVSPHVFVEALAKNRSLLDIGGFGAPLDIRQQGARIIARNRIQSLTTADGNSGVPAGLWPRVFTCRGFAHQRSILYLVAREVVFRGAWPTNSPRKRRLNSIVACVA